MCQNRIVRTVGKSLRSCASVGFYCCALSNAEIIDTAATSESNIITGSSFAIKPGAEANSRSQAQIDSAAPAEMPHSAAGDTAAAASELDRIVVTATRSKRWISQVPASVSILSRDDIEAAPARGVDELLQHQTSVQMRRIAGIGEGVPNDIVMRAIPGALAATRVLILVDGIPTNVSGTPFLIINEIPLGMVDRVEIVRGPYSSLYGANAFGGVINVITKSGGGQLSGSAAFETSFPFTAMAYAAKENGYKGKKLWIQSGSDGYWNAEALCSGGGDRFGYCASGGYRTVGNYYMSDSLLRRGVNGVYHTPTKNCGYRDLRFFGKLNLFPGERVSADLHTRYFNSSLGLARTKRVLPDSADIIVDGEKALVGPYVKIKLAGDIELRAGGYFRRTKGDFYNEWPKDSTGAGNAASHWGAYSNDFQLEAQCAAHIGEHQVVTGGIENLWNNITFGAAKDRVTGQLLYNANSVDTGITNAALFLQDEITIGKLILVPGLRYDHHSDFGGAWSPKFGMTCQIIDGIHLRASAGKAFRAPSHTELFMPDFMVNSDYTIRSNPRLKPETVWAADGGLEIAPVAAMRLRVDGFYNWMKELITPNLNIPVEDLRRFLYDTTGHFILPVTHRNLVRAWSRGIELEGEWQAAQWFAPFCNAAFQRSMDEQYKVPLDFIPDFKASFGVRSQKRWGIVHLQAEIVEGFTGKRGYFYWDAGLPIGREARGWPDDWRLEILPGGAKGTPPYVRLPGYWRTDADMRCELFGHYSISLVVQNLLNARFEESGGSYYPGIFASIKLGASF